MLMLLNEDLLLEKIATLSKSSLEIIANVLEQLSPGTYFFDELDTRSNSRPEAIIKGIKVIPSDVNTGDDYYYLVVETSLGGFETFPLSETDLYDQAFIHGQLPSMRKSHLMY